MFSLNRQFRSWPYSWWPLREERVQHTQEKWWRFKKNSAGSGAGSKSKSPISFCSTLHFSITWQYTHLTEDLSSLRRSRRPLLAVTSLLSSLDCETSQHRMAACYQSNPHRYFRACWLTLLAGTHLEQHRERLRVLSTWLLCAWLTSNSSEGRKNGGGVSTWSSCINTNSTTHAKIEDKQQPEDCTRAKKGMRNRSCTHKRNETGEVPKN